MTRSNLSLIYAVRPRVLLKYGGQLLFVAGLLNAIPSAASLLLQAWRVGLCSTGCSVLLVTSGGLLSRIHATERVQQNELLVITAAVFLVASIVLAVPFWIDGIAADDALFESVSALTTTGLSTLASVENHGADFLFRRAWMQWCGGLGFVVVSLAFIVPSGVAARSALQNSGAEPETMSGARYHARIAATAYAVLTTVAFFVLVLTGLGARDAVCYALAGVSTGGFAPKNDSLTSLAFHQQFAVQFVAALGALSLVGWHFLISARRRRTTLFDEDFVVFVVLCCAVFGVLFGILSAQPNTTATTAARTASILALSAQSTTGFAPSDVSALPDSAKAVMCASMLIGGEFGSTAGGFKVVRLLILIKVFQVLLVRVAAPQDAVFQMRYNGQPITLQSIVDAAIIGTLFIAGCWLIWLPFLVAGFAPLDALFEAASAIGTVGLSTGITGPDLPLSLKLVLCGGMLLGRLEIVAWIVLISPRSWFGRRKEAT